MFDIALAIIALASAAGLIAVVGRKLAIASTIDLKRVPERKTDELKDQLIEERFSRNLRTLSDGVQRASRPVLALLRLQKRRLVQRLKELEERYSLPKSRAPADDASRHKVTHLLNQARACVEDGLIAEAEQKCLEVLSYDQYNRSAYRLLGEVYVAQKDFSHAREVYEFLLKLRDDDADAQTGLGRVAVERGELRAAEAEFQKSLELTDAAGVRLDLAEVYVRLGDNQRALTVCQDALALDPRNPKLLDFFLTLAIAVGKRDLAEDALRKLAEVNPENQKLEEFEQQVQMLPRA